MISKISTEIWVHIFKFTSASDLIHNCQDVSMEWRQIIATHFYNGVLKELAKNNPQLSQKFHEEGWTKDCRNTDLICSLFHSSKRQYALYGFSIEAAEILKKSIDPFLFRLVDEKDATHIIVAKDVTDGFFNNWLIRSAIMMNTYILKEDYIQSSHKYKNEGTFISEVITKFQHAYRFHGPWDWQDIRGQKVSVFCDEAHIKVIEKILNYQGAIVIEMNNADYFGRKKEEHIIFHPENQEVNISQIIEDGLNYTHGFFSFDNICQMFREMRRNILKNNCRNGSCLYCK